MARKKTILKKQRQEAKRREYNRLKKSKVKSTIKAVKKSVLSQDGKSGELIKKAVRTIDVACAKGVIHKNTASRKKSRLAKFKNKFGAGAEKSGK